MSRMTTFTVCLPKSNHEIEVGVHLLGYSGNGRDEPRTLEYGDVEFNWLRTGRPVKQSSLIDLIDTLWSLDDAEKAAGEDY
jgi:hypothetical protein